MPKRIFIGGLSAQTTEAELQRLLRGNAGLTALRLETDAAGSPRGVADFSTDEEAAQAMRALLGTVLHGNPVRITTE